MLSLFPQKDFLLNPRNGKTLDALEEFLVTTVKERPLLLSEVPKRIRQAGFSYTGRLSLGIGKCNKMRVESGRGARLKIMPDGRHNKTINFLVLSDEVGNERYLSACPNFVLSQSSNPMPDNGDILRPGLTKLILRVCQFLRRFFFGWISGVGYHVPHKTWNRFVQQLKGDTNWTAWIRFRNDRPSFTASEFIGGDDEAMIVSLNGRAFEIKREDVAEIQLVEKEADKSPKPVDGSIRPCRISAWYDEREFGFARDIELNSTYFFTKMLVHDYFLLQSLHRGITGQDVKCRIIAPPTGKKYAKVEILAAEQPVGTSASETSVKARAIRAEHSGDLRLAESLYLAILKNPANPDFETALKNLAGIYNRTDSNRALELLSKYEQNVSDTCRKTLEHLKFLYYKRAGRLEEAYKTARRLLQDAANPAYESFVNQFEKNEMRDRRSRSANDQSFLPFEMRYGEFLVRNVDFGDWSPGDAAIEDVKNRYIELRESGGMTIGWGTAAAIDRADYSLRRCALNYWMSEKLGEQGWVYENDGKRQTIGLGQMRNEWRQYFFWSAAGQIANGTENDACVIANLVNAARCARRPNNGEWDYCQLAIPLVIVSLTLKRNHQDILAVFESKRKGDSGAYTEEETVKMLLGELAEVKKRLSQDSAAREELLKTIKAYSLFKVLPYFRELVDFREENYKDEYEDVLAKVMEFTGRNEADLTEAMIRSAKAIIRLVKKPDEHLCQIDELLDKGLLYVGVVNYTDKKRLYEDMGIIWQAFIERHVKTSAELHATDVYFPVAGFVMDCMQADMARRSMIEVPISLNVASEKNIFESSNTVPVEMTMKSMSVTSPMIVSAAFFIRGKSVVDGEDQTPAEIYPDQDASVADGIKGGEAYTFSVEVAPTLEERAAGMGSVSVLVQYTTDGGFKGEKEFECSYKLVDRAELVPEENPYSSQQGSVGDLEFFVGRERELARIRKRFIGSIGGQCFVLWGQRRSGKSSICGKFYKELKSTRSDVVYCYLDAQSWSNDLERRFTNGLCTEIERQCGQIVGLQAIREDAYDIRLNHVADFLHKSGRTLIVALDEASTPYNNYLDRGMHEEDKYRAIDFMRFLKSRVNGARNFHLLLIGQDTMKDFLEDSDFANEFAVAWEEPLNYLTKEDIRELVSRGFPKMKNGRGRITDAAFDELYRQVRGAPYFAQMFLYWLYEYLYESELPIADMQEINATVEILCHGRDGGEGRLDWRNFEQWTKLRVPGISIDDAKMFYRHVALKTRGGMWCSEAELVSTEIEKRIFDIAVNRHILDKQDGKFRLLVELFAEWLLANECKDEVSNEGK